MKTTISTILLVILLTISITAQGRGEKVSTTKSPEAILRVQTDDDKTLELKSVDLAKLPRREVKIRAGKEKETIYEGVDMREVLQLAGIKFDKDSERLNLRRYLVAEGADNYRVVFAFAEIDSTFTDKIIMLAEKMDGNLLPDKNGQWQIIVPDDKKRGRWVRQVVRLMVLTPVTMPRIIN